MLIQEFFPLLVHGQSSGYGVPPVFEVSPLSIAAPSPETELVTMWLLQARFPAKLG